MAPPAHPVAGSAPGAPAASPHRCIVVSPPEFVSPTEWFRQIGSNDETFQAREWALAAESTWRTIEALTAGSKRNLEESCLATISCSEIPHDDMSPLLAQTVALLTEKPKPIKGNLFTLQSKDFQQLALWLNCVLGTGIWNYLQLRDASAKLHEAGTRWNGGGIVHNGPLG